MHQSKDLPQIVVDGNWISMRSFCVKNKPQDKGVIVEGIMQSLLKLIREDGYQSEIKMTFDYGKWRYRPKTKFKEYKANREYDNSFEILWSVMNELSETILPAIGIKSYRVGGLEADDLGHYLANIGRPTMLHTRDRDWYGSINENTVVLHTDDGLIGIPELLSKYGLKHYQDFMLYKAITGDGSDNIPPVAGEGMASLMIMEQYKKGNLDKDTKFKVDSNYELMRLDRILHDQEVISLMETCDSKVSVCMTPLRKLEELVPHRFPPYFQGVLGKYNRVITNTLRRD